MAIKSMKTVSSEETPKLIYTTGNPVSDVRIYSFNGHKFRIYCHQAYGQWNPSLYIMSQDGTWGFLENNSTLCISWKNLYFLGRSDKELGEMREQNEAVVKAFLNYIKSVY